MVVCEYFFKEFYSRGSEEYLNSWVAQVDRMGREGWEVLDSTRCPLHPGSWTVVLTRPARGVRHPEAHQTPSEDEGYSGQPRS